MKILGRVVSGYSGFQELDAEGVEAWAWGLGVGLCILGIFHGGYLRPPCYNDEVPQ